MKNYLCDTQKTSSSSTVCFLSKISFKKQTAISVNTFDKITTIGDQIRLKILLYRS